MRYLLTFLFLISIAGNKVFAASATRPPLAKPYVVAPLILDGRAVADAWIFPRDGKRNFSIEAEPLLKVFQPLMKDELFNNLKQRMRSEGVFTLADLEAVGISAKFEENLLEMHVDLPLKFRKSSDLNLNYIEIDDQKFLRPQEQSGYLNLRMQQSYQYGSAVNSEKLPATGHVDFVENVHGVVLESMADYLEYSDYPWKRQDTRLRYDDEKKNDSLYPRRPHSWSQRFSSFTEYGGALCRQRIWNSALQNSATVK